MLTYKHVLLSVDLSASSAQVAATAYQIAEDSHALLSVVHVIEHSPVSYGGEFSLPVDMSTEEIERQVRQELETMAHRYHIPPEQQYLQRGSVKAVVTKLALELHADLIVVGTHGHRGLDILLGSRANAILHQAPCDVLVVRVKEQEA